MTSVTGKPATVADPADTAVLRVEDLRTEIRRRHDVIRPVDGVSFAVLPGETLGLVGESGCGKTMTGSSIMRLLPPGAAIRSGHIWFGGRDLAVADGAALRRVRGNDIGMIFQDPMTSLNPVMTVGRQVAEPVRLHRGLSKDAAWARAVEMLDLVGVPHAAQRARSYPHQLSGGLRQRVMIAMALACEPKLLIADEPTTALDVTTQAQILALLENLKAELGMALLLITHDIGVIAEHADRVMVMYAGKIVEAAPTGELFGGMRHPYTEALLAAIPTPDQNSDRPLYSIPGTPPEPGSIRGGCRFAPRCAYATDRCRSEEPPLHIGAGQHSYTCFHPRDTSVGEPILSDSPVQVVDEQTADAPRAGGRTLLELDDVSKVFRLGSGWSLPGQTRPALQAVSNVSLSIHEGETFAIVGESGCGKTTLGRMMVALERPTAGRVRLGGTDLVARHRELRRHRRDLQLMFQDPTASLDPRMRIGATVREPLLVQRVGTSAEQRRRVLELLRDVGLSEQVAQRFPHELSGGQRQRVGLARALALRPQLIVADEPVSALDVSVRSQILNLMKSLQRAHRLTYVVITHDLSVARYLADRVCVMYLGQIAEIGPAADIYARPAHPYTAGLLEAIPVPNPAARRPRSSPIRGELPSPLDPPSGCRFRTRCPRAQRRCAIETPKPRRFGAQHSAACHFPLYDPSPG